MAMSFHTTWEPLDQLSPGLLLPFHEQQSEVADALLGFFSESSDASHLAIDSLFAHHDDHLCNQTDDPTFLPSFNQPSFSAPSMLDLPLTTDEFELYHCPKRPRSCGDLYNNSYDLMLEAEDHYNVPMVAPEMADFRAPELIMTDFNVRLPTPVGAMCNGEKKKTAGGCLSAQSMAARERRKRISEKTQELGRLIPGGNRMNTAEMFQAAYKYVQLLQAQVGILGFINSTQNFKVTPRVEERLQVLLKSTVIQEKLCNEGRCLIPKEAVEAVAKDIEIRSNPMVSRDLDRFMESMN